MKKYFMIIAAFSIVCVGCKSKENQQHETSIDAYSFSHPDSTWYDETLYSDCEYTDWLQPTKKQASNPLTAKLADAYNCAVVWRSTYSDMEKVWRFHPERELCIPLCELLDGFCFLDCSHIQDSTMRAKSDTLAQISMRAAKDTTIDFEWHHQEYMMAAIERYHTNNFGTLTDEMYDSLIDCNNYVSNYELLAQKRMQDDSLHQAELLQLLQNEQDINRRCIYAIEYAHSSSDGPHFIDAAPYLVDVMLAGEYSLYLNDVWRTWRAMMTTMMGMSRDSHIPNWKYNKMRKVCAMTTLEHIRNNPDDIVAINNFVVMAYTVNIHRFGNFMFGNQNVMDQMTMFPEYFAKYFD